MFLTFGSPPPQFADAIADEPDVFVLVGYVLLFLSEAPLTLDTHAATCPCLKTTVSHDPTDLGLNTDR